MIITESNIDNMKRDIEQSIDEFGIVQTLRRYKFPLKLADIMFQRTTPFTNQECYEILSYYIFTKKLLPKKYEDKYVTIAIEDDSMTGAWHFYIVFKKTKEEMGGYATMFWDGSDLLPINVDVYGNQIRNYDTDVELYRPTEINFEFYKISELLDWFNTNYYDIVIDTCTDWLEECRSEMFEWLSENDPDYID